MSGREISCSVLLLLSYVLGLRVHEVVRLDRATDEHALRTKTILIKGKGGLVRELEIGSEVEKILTDVLAEIPRGEKLFVPSDKKAHQIIRSVYIQGAY